MEDLQRRPKTILSFKHRPLWLTVLKSVAILYHLSSGPEQAYSPSFLAPRCTTRPLPNPPTLLLGLPPAFRQSRGHRLTTERHPTSSRCRCRRWRLRGLLWYGVILVGRDGSVESSLVFFVLLTGVWSCRAGCLGGVVVFDGPLSRVSRRYRGIVLRTKQWERVLT